MHVQQFHNHTQHVCFDDGRSCIEISNYSKIQLNTSYIIPKTVTDNLNKILYLHFNTHKIY